MILSMLTYPLTTNFQVKAAIIDKISNIMIDKTGQKGRQARLVQLAGEI